MQGIMQNRWVVGLLIFAIIALIYTFTSGGFSGGGSPDIMSVADIEAYKQEAGITGGTTSRTPEETPSEDTQAAPATSGTGGEVRVVTAAGMGEVSTKPVKPEAGADGKDQVKKPPTTTDGGGINQSLLAFRELDAKEIIRNKYDELEGHVTEPENFAEDIGRVDPMTFVSDFFPEELRPPRSGETNDEEMWKFIEEAVGYDVLNGIRISVHEVINMGNSSMVIAIIEGRPISMVEGQSVGSQGVLITASSIERTKVVFTLSFRGQYAQVSTTRTFISRDY